MGREESVMVGDADMLRRLYRDAVASHPEFRPALRSSALKTAEAVADREGLPSVSRRQFVRLVIRALDSVDTDDRLAR